MKSATVLIVLLSLSLSSAPAGNGRAGLPRLPELAPAPLLSEKSLARLTAHFPIRKDPALSPTVLQRRLVPEDYPTIQEAINSANDGDTVLVRDSTYYENIYFGKRIIVASYLLIDGDPAHVAHTIIDGSKPMDPALGSTVLFYADDDTSSVLYGFTITGGTGTFIVDDSIRAGGGILCVSSGGAGILFNAITNNQLTDAVPLIGGGIAAGPPGSTATLIISNNTIAYNTVTGTSAEGVFAEGGGLGSWVSLIQVHENTFEGNTVHCDGPVWGAGMFISGNSDIQDNVITGNELVSDSSFTVGGGLSSQALEPGAATTVIAGNLVSDNISTASSPSSLCFGGGIDIVYPVVFMTGNSIIDNTTSGSLGTYGAGCRIAAAGTSGVIDANLVSGNRDLISPTSLGGGMYLDRSSPLFTNNIFMDNDALEGSGVFMLDVDSLAFINNTITANTGGAGMHLDGASVVVLNSILWGNPGGPISAVGESIEVRYSNIDGDWPGEGNMDLDPGFINGYQLDPSSPMIGRGIDSLAILGRWYHAPATDLRGLTRPMPEFTQPDLGAWEEQITGSTGIEGTGDLPFSFSLAQNYPNPFNPVTKISYSVGSRAEVSLQIFDLLGRSVGSLVNGVQEPGTYEVQFDAKGLSSGIYLYRLRAGSFTATHRMLLLK